MHWTPRGAARPDTWRELLAAGERGLARAVGVSNYHLSQIDELIAATGVAPAVNQIPWSPSQFDGELLAESRRRGVVVEGYSPLKSTNLRHRVLVRIAERYGATPAQVVLRWHIDTGVVVIPKSGSRDRIAGNLDLFDFALTADEVLEINGMSLL